MCLNLVLPSTSVSPLVARCPLPAPVPSITFGHSVRGRVCTRWRHLRHFKPVRGRLLRRHDEPVHRGLRRWVRLRLPTTERVHTYYLYMCTHTCTVVVSRSPACLFGARCSLRGPYRSPNCVRWSAFPSLNCVQPTRTHAGDTLTVRRCRYLDIGAGEECDCGSGDCYGCVTNYELGTCGAHHTPLLSLPRVPVTCSPVCVHPRFRRYFCLQRRRMMASSHPFTISRLRYCWRECNLLRRSIETGCDARTCTYYDASATTTAGTPTTTTTTTTTTRVIIAPPPTDAIVDATTTTDAPGGVTTTTTDSAALLPCTDCDGNDCSNLVDASNGQPVATWVGDGICDNGTPIDFNCASLSCDGGDCTCPAVTTTQIDRDQTTVTTTTTEPLPFADKCPTSAAASSAVDEVDCFDAVIGHICCVQPDRVFCSDVRTVPICCPTECFAAAYSALVPVGCATTRCTCLCYAGGRRALSRWHRCTLSSLPLPRPLPSPPPRTHARPSARLWSAPRRAERSTAF